MSIHFQVLGSGNPLIVIHGLFGTSDNLKAIAKGLAEDFKVFLIDAPGHGDSDTVEPLTLTTMAEEVKTFAEAQGLTNFSILGHSLGGKIAMELAVNNPELIDKLIVADIAPVKYPRRHDSILAALKSVPLENLASRSQADKKLQENIHEPGVRGFLLKSLAKDPDTSAWEWKFDLDALEQNYDNLVDANSDGKFTGDVLFIIGGASNYVLPEHKEQITNRFPNVKPKIIQGTGHWLHAEKPNAFTKICREFLL